MRPSTTRLCRPQLCFADHAQNGIRAALAGLVERRNRSVLGVGMDSLVVLIAYEGGLVLLLRLR
jgi:hypothetical protein